MKAAYPIVMSKDEESGLVFVPDFQINTQGADYANAMEMARDAIGLIGIDMEDDKKTIPMPSDLSMISVEDASDIVTLVDVDFTEYSKQNDMRTVRRNVSLPAWLNAAADKAGLNVSAVLQNALKRELGIERGK